MTGDLCVLLRAQSFNGLQSVSTEVLPQEAPLPALEVTRSGTDPAATLDGGAVGLRTGNVTITAVSRKPAEAQQLVDAVAEFLEPYSGPMGNRTIAAVDLLDGGADDHERDELGQATGRFRSSIVLAVHYE